MSPDKSEHSDEELLLSAATLGDVEAYGTLYERYMHPIYQYVYYRIGDVYESEDITETIFLKAWEALPRINHNKFNFRAWIYRIAHNVIIDRHRTWRSSVSLDQMTNLKDPIDTPEQTFYANEDNQYLVKLIQQLDPEMQQVIIQRFIMGISHAETAENLGLSEVHVRVLQHRGLEKIRKIVLSEARQYE
jgi:RNA polymerase sigma-70 factor, ECF subfamily